MEITINQNDNQNISIRNNNVQDIGINENDNQLITIESNSPQSLGINENDNQLILVDGGGAIIGISDVLVNGVTVVSGNIAYVTVPTKTSELVNNSGFITSETDPTVPSYIKAISLADINNWNNKQNTLVSGTNIKTINNESLLGSGNINIEGTIYSAGTGIDITNNVISNEITSYNDLTDLPTIPTKTSDLNNDSDFVNAESLSEVAFTGSYNSLSDTPIIPDSTSDLINDSNFITSQEVSTEIQTAISTKQDTLVSGTNIKTINSQSLLGSGNLNVDTSVHTYNRLDILAVTSTSDQTYVDILNDITNDREFVIKSSNATYDVVAVRDDSGTISLIYLDFNAGIGSRLHRILLEVSGSTVTATESLLKTPSDLQINGTSIVNSSTSIADIETKSAYNASTNKIATETDIASYHDSSKQDTLVSGTNIKTINNTSILGSGNITIQGTVPANVAYKDVNNNFSAEQTISNTDGTIGSSLTVIGNNTFQEASIKYIDYLNTSKGFVQGLYVGGDQFGIYSSQASDTVQGVDGIGNLSFNGELQYKYNSIKNKAKLSLGNNLSSSDRLNLITYDTTGNQLINDTIPIMSDLPNINTFKIARCSKTVTVNSGDSVQTLFAPPTISGYTFLGIIPDEQGFADQWIITYGLYGGNIVGAFRSLYPASLTATIIINLLYIENNYYNNNVTNYNF